MGAVLGSLLEDAYGVVGVSVSAIGGGEEAGEEGGGYAGEELLYMTRALSCGVLWSSLSTMVGVVGIRLQLGACDFSSAPPDVTRSTCVFVTQSRSANRPALNPPRASPQGVSPRVST